MPNRRLVGRASAILTVAALAFGGLLAGGAASATPAADGDRRSAPTSGEGYLDLVRRITEDSSVTVVGVGADDTIMIRTAPIVHAGPGARSSESVAEQIAAEYDNVVIAVDAPIRAHAVNDLVGGAGFISMGAPTDIDGETCSVGFNGFDGSGNPVVITAGHCTQDGLSARSWTTVPTGDQAYDPGETEFDIQAELGTLEFFRFGGGATPDDPGTDGDRGSTDIAIIAVANPDLNPLASVTRWEQPPTDDLASSATPVTGVAVPVLGETACHSGRTTGWSCAEILIVDGWAKVSGRWVYGFGALLNTVPGDSGGSVISGGVAIGVVSGGNNGGFTWVTELVNALDVAGDYTVRVFVAPPALTSPVDGGDVIAGALITGTAPAGSVVVVTSGSRLPFEVPVGGDGTWSFPAPSDAGAADFSVRAKIGFSTSTAQHFTVNVVGTIPPDSPAGGSAVLAATGTVALPALLAGTVLAVVGALLMLQARMPGVRPRRRGA